MNTQPDLITTTSVVQILDEYRAGNALRRGVIRLLHPGLKLEFDAVEMHEWREAQRP